MKSASPQCVITWGEVLWDCLPRGLFLGGAPFNVAYHLHQLGVHSAIISAVGDDFPGREILQRVRASEVDARFLKQSSTLETGYVSVELSTTGNACYTIAEPVAWDEIEATDALLDFASGSNGVVFGTLAQRGSGNRRELEKILKATPGTAFLDINLRQPYDDPGLVLELSRTADVLKLNNDELQLLSGAGPETPLVNQCEQLASVTQAKEICVTLGAEGALYWSETFHAKAASEPVEVKDTVGAGDAFMAAFVRSHLKGSFQNASNARAALADACCLGAFVASKDGATPSYDISTSGL